MLIFPYILFIFTTSHCALNLNKLVNPASRLTKTRTDINSTFQYYQPCTDNAQIQTADRNWILGLLVRRCNVSWTWRETRVQIRARPHFTVFIYLHATCHHVATAHTSSLQASNGWVCVHVWMSSVLSPVHVLPQREIAWFIALIATDVTALSLSADVTV